MIIIISIFVSSSLKFPTLFAFTLTFLNMACLRELRNIMKTLCQDSRFPGVDL